MHGSTYGDLPYGDEKQPYVGFVESTATFAQTDEKVPVGGSMSASSASMGGDGAVTPSSSAIVTTSSTLNQSASTSLSDVSVAEATAPIEQQSAVSGRAVMIVEATASFLQSGEVSSAAAAISASTAAVSQSVATGIVGGSTSFGVGAIRQNVSMGISASAYEQPAIRVVESPELMPLAVSHEDGHIERELKELFMTLFEANVRESERYVNALGMPHNGPTDLVSQSLTAQGLSIFRGVRDVRGVGAYLLRSWVAHNPKRGLKLLQTYLQLMWPNSWTVVQMWQDKSLPYPEGLVEEDGGNHYLTSRVNVSLPGRITDGSDVNAIQIGLRAAVPARMVMNISITDDVAFRTGVASAYYLGATACHYEGTFK